MANDIPINQGVDEQTPFEFHDTCPNCGEPWTAQACGPSHAAVDARRRQAYVELTDALAKYLETIGWRAIVAGSPKIQQPTLGGPMTGKLGKYEFAIDFSGGRRRWPADQS